jgi:ribosomal protein L7/L12
VTEFREIKSLQDRIARIEQTVKEIQESMGDEPEGGDFWGDKSEQTDGEGADPGEAPLSDEEMDLLHTGKKIEAIKAYHERTGAGLKEAKEAVERFEAR